MHASPDAGFDQPFAMLSACHERLYRMLQLLERLAAHLPDNGCDPHAVGAARDLTRYFDVAAPAHHEDEERHVLPALRAAGDDAFAAQLEQEHHEMRRRWAELRANLALVIDRSWCDAAVGAGSTIGGSSPRCTAPIRRPRKTRLSGVRPHSMPTRNVRWGAKWRRRGLSI
jgi:hypothetical protein